MAGVVSYSEDAELAGQVAAAGAKVAEALGVSPMALEIDDVSPGMKYAGNVQLVKGDKDLEEDADATAASIVGVVRTKDFRALLIGDTRFGTVVAGKVAARLRIGSLGKGKKLKIEGETLVATRDVYGGKFLARVAAKMPCVALLQRGAATASGGQAKRTSTVNVSVPPPKVSTIEVRPLMKAPYDIKTAQIIVSAGRGFQKKDDLALAQGLASALGAALGCSRPLSSELGWMAESQHIGLTGAYVHPKLYIAVGISGQLQHVAGIKDSKVIVAINKDPQAPIFQNADYGIVGDLYEVLPALTRAVSAR